MRGAALLTLVVVVAGCTPAAERRPASPTSVEVPGTLAVRVLGGFAWPHRVRRVQVALDGQLLALDRSHEARIAAADGSHGLTTWLEVAFPCHPGSRDQ